MTSSDSVSDEIFPKGSGKTYALVEIVRGESPSVGKGPDDTVFAFPVVLLWEIVLALGASLMIFLFSLVKQAPLEQIANPLVTTDPAKAPWYFLGLQELLEHMHPTLAGVIIPSLLVMFLVVLPFLDPSSANAGKWFSSRRGRHITAWTALYTAIVMTGFIVLDNAFSLRELLRGILPSWISQGLIPAGIIALLVGLPLLILARAKANRRELMLALFTVMLVSAVVFTISGFLFRGPGFKMYWPWQMPDGYSPWDGL